MDVSQEKLFEAFGELIYVVAMADGVVQESEKEAFETLMEGHPWSKDVVFSFNYELKRENDIDSLYQKVLNLCHAYGPSPDYPEFIAVLERVATASDGIDAEEKARIDGFSRDLLARFNADIDALKESEA